MNNLKDEQLRRLCDLVIKEQEEYAKNDVWDEVNDDLFDILNAELTRREELADLNFDDCESCKL